MNSNLLFTILIGQSVLIGFLIYVICQLKRHIMSLEAKIYEQQLSLKKLQKNIEDINNFLNVNTSKWRGSADK